MLAILSREQMRAFDAYAIEQMDVPGLVLMENAGRGAAHVVAQAAKAGCRVLVLAGKGNNGGDGFVVARHLMKDAFEVTVALLGKLEELKGDAATNARAWGKLGGECIENPSPRDLKDLLKETDVVVDAIFGTGLDREILDPVKSLIDIVNESRRLVVALDIPSGLDADHGYVHGCSIRAHVTVTFGHPKLGLFSTHGFQHRGKLEVVDIGVPARLASVVGQSALLVEQGDAEEQLRKAALSTPTLNRSIASTKHVTARGLEHTAFSPSHKGEAGRVLVLAGSEGTLGAARLTAHAALRAGAGLVSIATFGAAADHLQANTWEVMTHKLDERDPVGSALQRLSWASAIVIGPGFGTSEAAKKLMDHVALNVKGPVIIDADALTHFAGRLAELSESKGQLLLTPHPAEAARLLGTSTESVEHDRFGAVQSMAQASKRTVLLKGVHTLVASPSFVDDRTRVNASGNSALATAGSGDVLSGLLGALSCRLPAHHAAWVGAWAHGKAAEQWCATHAADRGLLAREIADQLPRVLSFEPTEH